MNSKELQYRILEAAINYDQDNYFIIQVTKHIYKQLLDHLPLYRPKPKDKDDGLRLFKYCLRTSWYLREYTPYQIIIMRAFDDATIVDLETGKTWKNND